jgi:hypothetical protein
MSNAEAARRRARRRVDRIRRRADAITTRLLYSDEPDLDLDLAMGELREYVRKIYPDRAWLFDAIYAARWQRLRDQGWRHRA